LFYYKYKKKENSTKTIEGIILNEFSSQTDKILTEIQEEEYIEQMNNQKIQDEKNIKACDDDLYKDFDDDSFI